MHGETKAGNHFYLEPDKSGDRAWKRTSLKKRRVTLGLSADMQEQEAPLSSVMRGDQQFFGLCLQRRRLEELS